MKRVSDQVVVITGASSGIGRATALHMAARGARIVGVARGAAGLASLVREIEAAGGSALAIPGDVTREDDMRAAAHAAVERFGRLDTWINAAGIYIQGRVQDIELDEYRRVIDVNLVGVINGTRCALEPMLRQRAGTIIQLSSILGLHGAPYTSAYAAAKAGIDGFVDALRGELWGSGVRVAVVYPPTVDTPIYRSARAKLGTVPLPPPPVVSPELAARVVAGVAERPRRARTFGAIGHAYQLLIHALPAPALDAVLHRALEISVSDVPAGPDNFDTPIARHRTRDGWMDVGWRGLRMEKVIRTFPRESAVVAAALGILAAGAARRLTR